MNSFKLALEILPFLSHPDFETHFQRALEIAERFTAKTPKKLAPKTSVPTLEMLKNALEFVGRPTRISSQDVTLALQSLYPDLRISSRGIGRWLTSFETEKHPFLLAKTISKGIAFYHFNYNDSSI